MEAMDLARQVVAYTQPTDRPYSPLVLVVFSRSWRGRDVRNENNTMRITAIVENGQLILRVAFPSSNRTTAIGSRNTQNNDVQQTEVRTILEYDGNNNLEGAASCIEGHMSCSGTHDIMLFQLLDDGSGLGPNALARWSLSFEEERGNQTASRLQIMQQILRSLLVR